MPDPTIITVERQPNAVVIHVQPEILDETNTAAIRTEVSTAAAESPQLPVVLDMAKVGFMPSLSLGELVLLLQELRDRGQRLVLSNLRPPLRQLIAITHLDRLFELHDGSSGLPGG
jgi:anti-sigma B factor antagonist